MLGELLGCGKWCPSGALQYVDPIGSNVLKKSEVPKRPIR